MKYLKGHLISIIIFSVVYFSLTTALNPGHEDNQGSSAILR